MITIMNKFTGKILGSFPCRHPELGEMNDIRTTINIEYGFSYSVIWSTPK